MERHLCDSISEGLSEGLSAQKLSQKIREDLRYPDKLFRRVRNKYGALVPSRSARAFQPGQGVYRSSYKNAMRLARTEINSAYRTADHERWQGLDFVKGIRVSLSNNHTCNGVPFRDICDDLQGVYPKEFKFTGWHPQCRCIATPILEDFEEFLKRNIDGGEARKGVEEVPRNFKEWVRDNQDRIARAEKRGTLPYWYRDNRGVIGGVNYKDIATKLKEGLKPFQPNTYVAFEPFSPAIIEAISQAKDRKTKNAIFEGILNDPRATTLHTTKTAKTTIYPNHKGKRSPVWQETQEMSKELNERGISVCFLPEMEEVRCTDALLKVSKRKWVFVDFKVTTSRNYNTIAEDIIDGLDQANTIILKATRIDRGIFNDVIDQLKRKRKMPKEIILINKYNKIISLTYADIIKNNGKNKLKGFF